MGPQSASAGLNPRHAEMQCWDRSLVKDLARCPSLQNLGHNNNNTNSNNSLGGIGIGRQDEGRSFYSPKDSGGASFFESDCFRPPSPLHLAALEEGMDDKQKLLPTTHHSQLRAEVTSLKELVGNLVSLISLNKGDPPSFQNGACEHVWDRACKDKLLTTKGAKPEDPSKACSTTACKQDKHQQLEQQKESAKTSLGIGTSIRTDQLEHKKLEQREGAATGCNNNKTTTNNNSMQQQQLRPDSLGTEAKRPPPRPWRILVDTGAEISVAPRSFAAEIQLSSLATRRPTASNSNREEDRNLWREKLATSLPWVQLRDELCDC